MIVSTVSNPWPIKKCPNAQPITIRTKPADNIPVIFFEKWLRLEAKKTVGAISKINTG